jgi:alkaline phosphatase
MNYKNILIFLMLFAIVFYSCSNEKEIIKKGNVIFMHPDGVGLAGWNAMRILYYGPDSTCNWDMMPHIGLYRSHLRNSLGASSNAGAVIHAYGVKADYNSFGLDNGESITAASGKEMTIMQEAKLAGIKTGIINSGSIIEPGSAVFVSSEIKRSEYESITKQVLESGTDVIFSGGEEWMIPEGEIGFHGKPGKRKDGLNLIDSIKLKGYTVVFNSDQLKSISGNTNKILGVFAAAHTFNDKSEEELIDQGLLNYNSEAPTLAEMTRAAIDILSKNNSQFFLVVEEEGTDNFGNKNNANATLEALKRADDAIAEARAFVKDNLNTLLIVASDSEAGGPEIVAFAPERMKFDVNLNPVDRNGAPMDGAEGQESKPFVSAPDNNGVRLPFAISWSSNDDTYGSVVAKAGGLNAELMNGSLDNTEIYKIMYASLFGKKID